MGRQRKLAQALEQLFSTPSHVAKAPVQEGGVVEAKTDNEAFSPVENIRGTLENLDGQDVEKKQHMENATEPLASPVPSSMLEPESQGALPSKAQQSVVTVAHSHPHPGGEEQHVIFTLGNGYYGLPVEAVEAIIKMQPITRIPKTPNHIRGVTNLRGTVLPVIDLRQRLGLPASEENEHTRIVVTRSQTGSAGLIVDSVDSVSRISGEQIEPPPPMTCSAGATHIRGVARLGERLVLLLDLESIWQGVAARGQGRNLYGTRPAQATLSTGNSTR